VSEDFLASGAFRFEGNQHGDRPRRASRQTLQIESGAENLNGLEGEILPVRVSEQKSPGHYSLSVRGQEVTVKSEQKLEVGEKINVQVINGEEGRSLEVVPGKQSGPNDAFARLFEIIGRSDTAGQRHRVLEWIKNNPESSAAKFISDLDIDSSGLPAGALKEINELLNFLKNQLSAGNTELIGEDIARSFLSEMEMQFSPRLVKLLKTVIDIGQMPDRSLLKELSANMSLLVDKNKEPDRGLVKSFLFLKNNELPVSRTLLNRVTLFAADNRSAVPWQQTQELPRWFFRGGGMDLQELIQKMGLDLERRLLSGDSKVFESARLLLERMQDNSESSGGEREAGGLLMKHALGSLVDEKTLYLIIPFQEDEQLKFARVRFQDKRKKDSEDRDKSWSVDLELTLSKLGYLRLKALKREEKLKVEILPEKKSAVRTIKKHLDLLEETLQELGYEMALKVRQTKKSSEKTFIEKDLFPLDLEFPGNINIKA
jgi:hypothetical protein